MNLLDCPKLLDYKCLLAALEVEYKASPNYQKLCPAGFWQFAAAVIFYAFHENDDDGCFDWVSEVIANNKAAIIAAHPELLDTEDGDIYLLDE